MEARAIYLTTLIDQAVVSDRDVIIHEDPFLRTCHNIPAESARGSAATSTQDDGEKHFSPGTIDSENEIRSFSIEIGRIHASHNPWILHRHASAGPIFATFVQVIVARRSTRIKSSI